MDIAALAENMGAADSAAFIIDDLLVSEMSDGIDALVAEGVIKKDEGNAWKRELRSVGAAVTAELLFLHDKLTRRAIELGIDPGEPSTGKNILMEKVKELADKRSGGR
jgi:hypothetical protein